MMPHVPSSGSKFSTKSRSLDEDELRKQDILMLYILDGESVTGTLVPCSIWYTQYLQLQFKNQWHILKTALAGLDNEAEYAQPGELAIVFDLLLVVAKQLKRQTNLTLVDVVDELDNKYMLRPQLDGERAAANQVVFAALGWLTMIYQAVPHPKIDKLEVAQTSTSSCAMRNISKTRKDHTYRLGFEYIDLPLYDLLSRFGDLIPVARPRSLYEQPAARIDHSKKLHVSSVCFKALHDLAELKIEWVTSLPLHLEVDSSRKTLKVFQFPSYCRLMTVEGSNNMISRLLNGHSAQFHEGVPRRDLPTGKFFEEVLLTYRLIFGQDERSWKLFKQIVPALEEQRRGSCEGIPWDYDPLLRNLCGNSCTEGESFKIYQELWHSDTNVYYKSHEFPFFGDQLFELQKLVNEQPARAVRALLGDRRNMVAWLKTWEPAILIAVGAFTIFLMMLQLLLQILQFAMRK